MNERAYRASEARIWDDAGRRPTESFVELPRIGVRIRVLEVGEGDPVLFVHGGPNAGSTWAPMVAHLDGYRCIVVDRPGTGLSEPFRIDRDNLDLFGRRFVGDVLDGVGLESAHLVASSFGGQIAIRSAAAEPDRVQRMVQMACPAFAPGMRIPPFMRLLTIGAVRRLVNGLPPNERAGDAILRQIGHGASLDAGRIPQTFKNWYMDLQRHTNTYENDTAMIGRLGTPLGFDQKLTLTDATLGAVQAPTLFLWGEDDGFGGEEVARSMIERMPAASLVMMPDAGHLPWLDAPNWTAEATARFLAGDQVEPLPHVDTEVV